MNVQTMPINIARLRLGVLTAYWALIGFFFVATPMMLGSLSIGTLSIALLQSLPLLLFAPGLQRTRLRSYGWMSFVVLLYFTHGVLVAFRPEQLTQGLIQVGLCVALFTALIFFIRQFREHYKTPL